MRIDRDWLLFYNHPEWYTVKKGEGYVPTEKAPPEIVEAIKRYKETCKRRKEEGYLD